MTKEVYKSANGKAVDMGALRLKNEKTRAVGNMRVNARGDEINERDQVIRRKNEQTTGQYRRQVNPSDPSESSPL